mmetsp:Transcript_34281/g.74373  ORF Transcript_34281/g.74373 Transcript_34281/m.74373 type:complete len:100 (+) Transcript_34281:105-404(+)
MLPPQCLHVPEVVPPPATPGGGRLLLRCFTTDAPLSLPASGLAQNQNRPMAVTPKPTVPYTIHVLVPPFHHVITSNSVVPQPVPYPSASLSRQPSPQCR